MVFITLVFLLSANNLFAKNPIEPKDVLSQSEISEIITDKNYFLYQSLDDKTSVWRQTKRQYGSHFLQSRNYYLSLSDVIKKTLTESFPLQYELEKLYRSKMSVLSSVGNILPKVNLRFGSGVGGLDIGGVFSGLFSFLLPHHWMQLVNERRIYKTSRYLLALKVYNEVLASKLVYIEQHHRIQDFEILNYYFIHLQLFAKRFLENSSEDNHLVYGKFSHMGTNMASQRGDVKLGFNQLAMQIALASDDKSPGAGRLNIYDLTDFPKKVPDQKDQEDLLRDKDVFLSEVLKKSLELKVAKEFVKISKLNIGIKALGGSLTQYESSTVPHDNPQFELGFSFKTIPDILISKSLKKTSVIDLKKELISMLGLARNAYDYYTNSLGGYTEAKRAMALNRKIFKANLQKILSGEKTLDAFFMISLDLLIKSELKLNNALHGFLKAQAHISRLLLRENDNIYSFLPEKGQILSVFKKIKDISSETKRKNNFIDYKLKNMRKTKDLLTFLFKNKKYNKQTILKAVERNKANLLFSSFRFRKSKRFYQTLGKYLKDNKIKLDSSEIKTLTKKLGR